MGHIFLDMSRLPNISLAGNNRAYTEKTSERCLTPIIHRQMRLKSNLQFAICVCRDDTGKDDFVVRIVKQGRGQEHVRRSTVGRECDVVERSKAGKSRDIILVTLNDEVVTEEDKHIDFAFRYHRTYLLISAERSGKQARNLAFEGMLAIDFKLLDNPARSPRRIKSMLGENGGVILHPIQEFILAPVVGNKRYADIFHTFFYCQLILRQALSRHQSAIRSPSPATTPPFPRICQAQQP